MQDVCQVGCVGTGRTEACNENQQTPANEGGRLPTDIASDGSVHQSLFVPNVNVRLQSMGTRGFTPSTQALATPGDERGRKENRQKITRKHQESVKMGEPEKELTLFAMRLAVLEKTASNIGTLAFIWATVVLLGGYAVSLNHIDFWFVTVILVIEGARIFSRSHELEWQHQDPGTSTLSRAYRKGSDALHRSSRAVRTVISNLVTPGGGRRSQFDVSMDQPESQCCDVEAPKILDRQKSVSGVSLIPFMSWIFRAKYISALLYSMQLISAVLSIILSVLRLISQDFIPRNGSDTDSNHTSALLIFYGLTVLEALIFLLERSYWQYQISIQNILKNAIKQCELPLNDESLYTVRHFFYDVYSKCLTGSVFEGLKMDMLDYTLSWLQSDTPSEQLAGVRALLVFSASSDKAFCEEALKTIGTRQAAVERLIEMITWKSIPMEREIRIAAAELLCNLVKFNRNSIRVAAISGSLDGIVSLLSEDNSGRQAAKTHDSHGSVRRACLELKNFPAHCLGLRILINLAKNPMNCTKIGETRGLLTRLINLIDADNPALRKYDAETETPKNSILFLALRLLGLLAGASGVPGKTLREEIAKVVVSISNLRGVLNLKHEGSFDVLLLQQYAARTLSSLAMDDNVSEVIGRTGGVIGNLFELFRSHVACGNTQKLKVALRAGEALKMLVLKPGKNCERIVRFEVVQQPHELRTDVVEELLKMLDDRERGHIAMCILSSVLKSTTDYADCKARIVARTLHVMEVMMEERGARQEAAIGLAARALPLLSKEERARVFSSSQTVMESGIVTRLRTVLDQNHTPSIRFPGIRRFCLDLILALLNADSASFLPKFLAQQFRPLLRQLAATTSDLENYSTFCNDIGVTFHTVLIEQLFDDAIAKLHLHEL